MYWVRREDLPQPLNCDRISLCFETKVSWLHANKNASPVLDRPWLEKKTTKGDSKRKIIHERTTLFLLKIPTCRPGSSLERKGHQASERRLLPHPFSSLTTLLTLLSQPFHGERMAFAHCRAMWQLKATLASSQSSRKREILSPDQFCPIAFRARLSTLCSH